MSFAANSQIEAVATAYAQDAVDFARRSFNLTLDWSDNSVMIVESIMERLHADLPRAQPSEEKIMAFAKMLGSYVGEVYRRNHGARWGIVTIENDSFPGMQASGSDTIFWPWGRAQNRINNGAEDNIWHYYQSLVAKMPNDHVSEAPIASGPKPRTPFLKRLFGA